MNDKTQQDSGVGSPPPVDSTNEDYDAAYAEFSGAGPVADPAQANREAESVGHADGEGREAPAPNQQAPDDSDGTSQAGENPTDDIWANATPEQREAFQNLQRDSEARVNTWKGRVAAKDRELDRLRSAPPPQQRQPQSDAQPNEDQGNQDKGSAQLPPEVIRQLREDYPDLAGPLLDLIDSQARELGSLKQGVGAFEQAQTAQAIGQQEQLLTSAHADWKDVAADERFGGWLQDQPSAIQQAFARNAEHIVDGRDAAFVIGQFKTAMGIGAPPAAVPQPAPAPAPEPKVPDARRQRQIEGGGDVGRTAPAATTGVGENDYDTAYAYFSKKADAQ